MTIPVISSHVAEGPFAGTWESPFTGYISSNNAGPPYLIGTASNIVLDGSNLLCAGICTFEGTPYLMLGFDATATTSTFFEQVTVQKLPSGTPEVYLTTEALYYPTGTNNTTFFGGGEGDATPTVGPFWCWTDTNAEFTSGSTTDLTFILPPPSAPAGNGDIPDPEAWQDVNGNIPPAQYGAVPVNVNFPLNGDGRYWFEANASNTSAGGPISFIGNFTYLQFGGASLQWSVLQTANDGSGLLLAYSIATGTWTTTTLLPQTQLNGLQNGAVIIPLGGPPILEFQVYAQGGTPLSTASLSQVAIAITRNADEQIPWDSPNPFDPVGYNGLVVDNVVPTDTLADLRQRILIRLGFANQAANPPPGMTLLVNDFLESAQTYLYRRYLQLHTKRLFRWKINPGQRFYSIKDSDENATEGVLMDYAKTVEWVGIQDSRNVWYPMIQGIPPQLYTMITKPWRPARYEIRGGIEIYPTPDQTYWLWIKGHFGLMPFSLDENSTTIDSELVFLWALANAKAHYGQPDAQNIAAQANAYRAELVASTHQTAHYLPGTIAVPPAVRPTLIQFDANSGGGS